VRESLRRRKLGSENRGVLTCDASYTIHKRSLTNNMWSGYLDASDDGAVLFLVIRLMSRGPSVT